MPDSGCSGAVFTSVDVGPDNNISAPIADESDSGLHAMGAVNLNVHNNTFTGGYDAVRLRLSVTGMVKDNVMSGYAKNGITVGKAADDNTGTDVTVSGNTVTGGGPGQVNAQNGIQVGPNAVARIENNTVSNHVYTLGDGEPPICVGPGTKGDAAYYDACWTAAGIMVYQGTATVTGNVITGNQVGHRRQRCRGPLQHLSGNILYGENNVSGGTANAENNWWGSCSGPSHPRLNPLGTGDAVSDNVDFDPWITDRVTLTATVSPTTKRPWSSAPIGKTLTRTATAAGTVGSTCSCQPSVPWSGTTSTTCRCPPTRTIRLTAPGTEGRTSATCWGCCSTPSPGTTQGPNANGVDYDTVKGSCTIGGVPDQEEGLCYDRSPARHPTRPGRWAPERGH